MVNQDGTISKVSLEVRPAFGTRLVISFKKDHLYCEGNLGLEQRFIYPGVYFESALSSSDYDYLIGNLKDITTPPFPSYGGGLDGITFEVKIENGLNKAHFSWWVECPERWKELEYLANRLITYARSTHNS
jgi:hypothetical protein